MKAILNGCCTVDGDELENFHPEDYECFRIDVDAFVGPEGSEGFENFRFYVTTLDYLKKDFENQNGVFLRHYLLVHRWDPTTVRNTIEKLVTTTNGKDWDEISAKLSRYGYWEFEDYTPLTD